MMKFSYPQRLRALHSGDPILFWTVIALAVIGLVAVYTSSGEPSLRHYGDPREMVRRQVIFLIIGLFFFIIASRVRFTIWKYLAWAALAVSFVLLLILFLKQLAAGGDKIFRFLKIGAFSFQPSELAKFSLILVLSSWIYKRNDRMETFGSGILIPLFIAGVLSTLILFEPDYSTAALIIAITLFMVFLGGAKLVHLASIILPVIVSGVGALLLKPYRIKRLIEFYSTDLEMSTGFTQIKQSIIALGRGGFIGKGIGNSLQKLRFLADCHTDFIYSIIGEEGGFLGAILVLLLFMVVLYRGYRIALRCPHLFGSLLAAGMTTSIGLNAFVHIMVTLKLVPTTGLTLPFISAGGTSLIITLVMVGIVLNVSRYTELERTKYIPGRMT